jgi:hypothetical protein
MDILRCLILSKNEALMLQMLNMCLIDFFNEDRDTGCDEFGNQYRFAPHLTQLVEPIIVNDLSDLLVFLVCAFYY